MIYKSLGKGEDKYYKTSFYENLFLWWVPHSLPAHASDWSQSMSGGNTVPEDYAQGYDFMIMNRFCGRGCEVCFSR